MDSKIFSLLIRVNRQRRRVMTPLYISMGLSIIQVSTMRATHDHPGLMQKQLAEAVGVSPPAMVGILRGLEERGLLESRRNAKNRRIIQIYVTDEGEKLLEQIAEYGDKASDQFLMGMTEEEVATLCSLLQRISVNGNHFDFDI